MSIEFTRRRLLGGAVVVLAAQPLFACGQVDGTQPARIVYDRDTCDHCAMLISERKFAAQCFTPKTGKHQKFDDVGCMVAWTSERRLVDEAETRLWVASHRDGTTWLDARAASYDDGVNSPMGYGFAAKPPGEGRLDFKTVKASAQKRAHCEIQTTG